MGRYIIKKLKHSSIIEHPLQKNGGIPNTSLEPGIILNKSHNYLTIRPTAVNFAKKHSNNNIYALFYVDGMAWCDFLFTISLNSKGEKVIENCRCCGVRGAYNHWAIVNKLILIYWKEIKNLSYDDFISIDS